MSVTQHFVMTVTGDGRHASRVSELGLANAIAERAWKIDGLDHVECVPLNSSHMVISRAEYEQLVSKVKHLEGAT